MIGILNIDKPEGLTSRQVVNQVCRIVPKKTRVGHCGTLDPLATGVLLVCVGPATRLIQFGQSSAKHYVGTFQLGLSSDTEDITGDVTTEKEVPVDREQLELAIPKFIGNIAQRPPAFSALRIDGKRAYDLARAGKEVNLKERTIEIYDLKLLDFDYPNFTLDIRCGSGTYVRSLGRDIAHSLGTHAVMTGLVRAGIGTFTQSNATQLDQLNAATLDSQFLAPELILGDMPRTDLIGDEFKKLQDGDWIRRKMPDAVVDLAAFDKHGRLAVVAKKDSAGLFIPKINFTKYWQALDD